jgi:hypothetical protein
MAIVHATIRRRVIGISGWRDDNMTESAIDDVVMYP